MASRPKIPPGVAEALSPCVICGLCIFLVGSLGFATPPISVFQPRIRQVALTGESAFKARDGAEYQSFGFPSLNESGDVAFLASLQTGSGAPINSRNRRAVIGPIDGPGSPLGVLVRDGDPVSITSVTDGVIELSQVDLQLTSVGEVVLTASIGPRASVSRVRALLAPLDGAGSPYGVWLREGSPAPGLAGTEISYPFPVFSESGDTVLFARLRSATESYAGTALFASTDGLGSPLQLITSTGNPAPGLGNDTVFVGSSNLNPKINSAGQIAFAGTVSIDLELTMSAESLGALFGPNQNEGGALGLIAREGAAAPGVTDGAEFGLESGGSPFNYFVEMSEAGDVAFTANLRSGAVNTVTENNDSAIFGPTNGRNSPLGLIAREGSDAPGTLGTATYASFGRIALNSHGDAVFAARLNTDDASDPTAIDEAALFGPTGGIGSEIDLIVRESELEDVIGGADQADSSYFSFQQMTLNDRGVLAFAANRGEIGTGRRLPGAGLFAYVDGVLNLVAREGDTFPVSTGEAVEERVIASISFGGLNNSGQLAFALSFDDGTGGVFIAETLPIPEPHTSLIVLALSFLLACTRR